MSKKLKTYDSRNDTIEHIREVARLLTRVTTEFDYRKLLHDASKLNSPEKEVFDEYTPKLKGSTYGSEEYQGFLVAMSPALEHHYAHNPHHPEYHGRHVCLQCGLDDRVQPCTCGGPKRADLTRMTLIDIIEMLCDWKAATLRHADGDLRKSIEFNQRRFGYTDEMKSVLVNTAESLGFFQESKS